MAGFVGMSPEGFLLCRNCDHQWHGITCDTISDNGCQCPKSYANPDPAEVLGNVDLVEAD